MTEVLLQIRGEVMDFFFFPTNHGETICFQYEKIKLDLFLTKYTKIISRQIKDLNVKGMTIKLLEDNIVEHLYGLEVGNEFLSQTQNFHIIKENIDYIKISVFR